MQNLSLRTRALCVTRPSCVPERTGQSWSPKTWRANERLKPGLRHALTLSLGARGQTG